jgi:hypothetical protein
MLGMPSYFPNHNSSALGHKGNALTLQNLRRVDVVGLLFLLGASILLVTALEEGGTNYSWHSSVTLSLLIISFLLWFLFISWERYQDRRNTIQEPIFPWRLATDRFVMGVLL